MTDFLDQKRREITTRLTELKPQVDEYQRLQAAADALAGVNGSAPTPRSTPAASATVSAPRRGRPKGSKNRAVKARSAATATAKKSARSGGRPKGSGTRAIQAVALIGQRPGITMVELAKEMGINRTYLYRVLPGLQQQGKLTKRGDGWHPAK